MGAFDGCGNDVGVVAWTVKKFELEKVHQEDVGTFYSGDAYLVLHTYKNDLGNLRHNIHYWIGKDSSQDEQGSIAAFTTQLDDHLGGGPVQYRQVQGHEDPEFIKLFPKLIVRPGERNASGFRHASANDKGPAKLYQIKSPSRTAVQVFEVATAVQSLNSGDSFVLEEPTSGTVFVWHGSAANIREKSRALDVANSMRRNTPLKIAVVDDDDRSSSDAETFFKALGVQHLGSVSVAAPIDDAVVASFDAPRLFLLGPGGQQELPKPLSRSQLDPEQQFGLAAAGSVWVWTGSKSAVGASAAALERGTQLSRYLGLPSSAPVKCVKDRFEPGLFMSYFSDWNHEDHLRQLQNRGGKTAAAPEGESVDVAGVVTGMVSGATAAGAALAKSASADMQAYGTSGSRKVWVVRGSALQAVPDAEGGEFWDGDSYVIDYTYTAKGQERHVLYFWLGRHSSSNEQGTAALKATELHGGYQGTSTLVRVVQNKEPAHFVRIFAAHGGLVVHKGSRPDAGGAAAPTGTRLYQIKAEGSLGGAHAVEVDATAPSLNSGDSFLLLTEGQASGPYLWQGRYSSAEERQVAAAAAQRLAQGHHVTTLEEGKEEAGFWTAVGGKAEYPQYDASRVASAPVLFHIRDTRGSGGVKVEPYIGFSQEDLVEEDVMMLDAGHEVFVWTGSACAASEGPRAVEIAKAYVRETGREQASIVEVRSGQEPPFFTQHFPGWDSRSRVVIADVYAEKLKALQLQQQ
eukprot:CAMPEP_0202903864 /NCGR_PEP_ID=MMETSP1392-20130828/26769_1 /ASSEMBLY_ACC=CAM_ASM_000868 /TAXON_ID=225041 /ORGANISM="Chlamydomonas chlamydogama, Strain SAG 11-48b" /LENGTH=742 /DNA_ID=CAMNT_0049591213 /DNA_START=30 /DNA_END=2258 /DNA_ORIENTATION=+